METQQKKLNRIGQTIRYYSINIMNAKKGFTWFGKPWHPIKTRLSIAAYAIKLFLLK